ncbi:MAG: oligogalacturonate lyase family protein [Verrucomicrobiae bacterium]|nr:oligogalacturonate lyase family protein [Verrucomicrobiae bacterium]
MPLIRLFRQLVIPSKPKTTGIFQFLPVTTWAFIGLFLCSLLTVLLASGAVVPDTNAPPPTSWVDPDTGHRVIRLTREPGSDSFYFNDNGFTPDGKRMAYTTPDGISVLNLETREAKPVVTGHVHAILVAHKSATLYYTRTDTNRVVSTLWCVNLDTGENRKLADLPRRANVSTINADETLGAGTFIEGDANAGGAYDGTRSKGKISEVNMGEPADKGEMMAKRLAAKLPMTLFTIDLRTGKVKTLLEHSTDWLNHLQFSPADPGLLMYCHEGAWQMVDRIWTIRTDGTQNQLIHQRTLENEIAGHEWWGADGQTVYYQLHFPRGGHVSYIASYNVATKERTWLQYNPDQSSIHDNSSPDGKLFCGDGDNHSPWIFLFRPVLLNDRETLGTNLIKGGYLESEKLVNMARQNYRLEPNPSFTPDMKFIVFRSNMFGPDYAFAVEIAKARQAP